MCLAVPGRVIEFSPHGAKVDIEGVVREADVSLLPGLEVGDYVIVHAGFAIERYDENHAKETLRLLREITDAKPA